MKIAAPLLFLAFLIPTGVQGALSVPIQGFRFYVAYALLALLPVFWMLRSMGGGHLSKDVGKAFRPRHMMWFVLFLLSGAISVFSSPNLRVGLFFWLWTAATVLVMPWIMFQFLRVSEKWILILTALFLAMNAGIILSDTLTLNIQGAGHALGSYVPFMRDGKVLFKPYVWQFEPSYFAGFMLMGALLFRVVSWRERRVIRIGIYLFTLLLVFAAMLSMSRTGIIGGLVFVVLEAISLLLSKKFFLLQTPGLILKRSTLLAGATVILCVLGGTFWYFSKSANLPPYLAALNFRQPSHDGSFQVRFQDALNGLSVFQQRPWFGSGPGLAKQDFFQIEAGTGVQDFKRKPGPIANSAYVELLSEWGIVGFLLYAAAIAAMFYSFENAVRLRIWILLSVLYLALGTVPRLSVWVFLALIWGFLQNQKGGDLRPSVAPEGTDSGQANPSSS